MTKKHKGQNKVARKIKKQHNDYYIWYLYALGSLACMPISSRATKPDSYGVTGFDIYA